jgi:hypothetical protein
MVTVIATGFNRDDLRADHRPMAIRASRNHATES